jgi:hypothetical protein
VKFADQEKEIIRQLSSFLQNLPSLGAVSKVTWGLFIQTYGQTLKEVRLPREELESLEAKFSDLVDQVYTANGLAQGQVLTLEHQSYLE